jgi:hypothetical protein
MSAGPRRVDVVAALKAVTDDPRWIAKLAIGSLVLLGGVLLVGLPLVIAYPLRVVRLAADGRPGLPEWEDWGDLYAEGLRAMAVWLVHYLPLGVAVAVPVLALGAAGVRWPEEGSGLEAVLILALALPAWLTLLAFAAYVNAALVRVTVLDRFSAAFEVGENLSFLVHNLVNWLLVLVVLLVSSIVGQFGPCLCCIGILPVTVWGQCAFHHAMGQVARGDARLLGAPRWS